MNTSVPPTYGDEFVPPTYFGHYPTKWDRWPFAELTIDRGHRDDDRKPSDEGTTDTTEEIPEPDNEMGTPGTPDDKDNLIPDNLFEPETNTPLPDRTPVTPPAEPPPAAPPDTPIEAPLPENTPLPGAPPAAEPEIPDSLIPNPTPPGHGSWESDALPSDAPRGDLVSDVPQPSRKDLSSEKAPTLAPPRERPATTPSDQENARRQSPVRGASAIGSPSLTEPMAEPITEPDAPLVTEPPEELIPIAEPEEDEAREPAPVEAAPDAARWTRNALEPRATSSTRGASQASERVTESAPRRNEPTLAEPRPLEPQPPRSLKSAGDDWKPTRSAGRNRQSGTQVDPWQDQTSANGDLRRAGTGARVSYSTTPDRKIEQTSTRNTNPLR